MAQTQGTSKALAILSDNTAAPQRRSSSLPIPVDDTLNVEEQAAAASLRARDSDSEGESQGESSDGSSSSR